MTTARLEAFSDGVLAIILTIMVLELPVPHEPTLAALRPALPVFLSYVLSIVYVGICWNRHHLFQAAGRVDGRALRANLHLLALRRPVRDGVERRERLRGAPDGVLRRRAADGRTEAVLAADALERG